MITCRDFAEFVWAYVSGELTQASRFEFDAHMAVCPHCVIYMESYLKTIALGRDAFADPNTPVPEDIPKDLVDAIMAAREKGGA